MLNGKQTHSFLDINCTKCFIQHSYDNKNYSSVMEFKNGENPGTQAVAYSINNNAAYSMDKKVQQQYLDMTVP